MKKFHIGDLLSFTLGKNIKDAILVSPEKMEGVRKVCHFLTGDDVFIKDANNHITPYDVYGPEVRSEILKQHPELAKVDSSKLTNTNVDQWLSEQAEIFGENLSLFPMTVDRLN